MGRAPYGHDGEGAETITGTTPTGGENVIDAMSADSLPMTAEGYATRSHELAVLRTDRRRELGERVREARLDGDVHGNPVLQDLLDEAITRVLHLDRGAHEDLGTMSEYKGTYSQYLAQRAKDEVRLMLAREHPDGLITPPPMAIAHFLMRNWVEGAGPG